MSVQAYVPQEISFAKKCQLAIEAIKDTMRLSEVDTIGMSYGKDSSTLMALTFEAARQLKDETGVSPRIRLLTADTLVENPLQTKLAGKMSARAVAWAKERGLDVEQIWVTPDPINHYLVSLLGMRGVASVPGSSATCTIQLKLAPMDKVRRKLAKQYGAENIAVYTGVRHEESTARSANMSKRGESSTEAYRTETGSLQLAPIAEWDEADVWRLLNGSREAGFEIMDFSPTIAHYELMGDSTCGTATIGQTAQKAKSPCSGGRGGCFLCQRVTKDHSMENIVEHVPYLEPLVRLSRTIRAGHFLPENRNFLAKAADRDNRIRIFSNAYSASFTSYLLKCVKTLDIREDEYVLAKSAKLGRPVERRFPRLLTEEMELLIAFQWCRYGVQAPGEYVRIREAIEQGQRWELPTDEELEAMEARADRKLMGQTFGYLESDYSNPGASEYRDHWRDLVGTESFCAPDIMVDDSGERAMYVNSAGVSHDTIEQSDIVEADLSEFIDRQELEDWFWWYALEFADQKKTHNEELNFLIRSGVIRARRGYQSHLAEYQDYNLHLHSIREKGPIGSLEEILAHPSFVSVEDLKERQASQESRATAKIIATDSEPKVDPVEKAQPKEEQLDLFVA